MNKEYLLELAKRCLQCKNALCLKGCPINTNIPNIIKLFKEDKIKEAGECLFLNNPLSVFCAYVCNHDNQCYGSCILNKQNKAIKFYEIEKYISSNYLKDYYSFPITNNKYKIAIIGSGPAGLSASIYLRQYGYQVTIYESKANIGGMLRYGIPEFRLAKSLIDDFKKTQLDSRDIKIITNITIGKDITIKELLKQYDVVLLSTGLWSGTPLNIKGENLANVHYSIDYLSNPNKYDLGDNVIIIGAGNAAIDATRTAIRNNVKNVTCFVRRNVSRSNKNELDAALAEGIKLEYSKMPIEITKEGVIFSDTYTDNNKAIKIANTEKLYPYTSVIISVSQSVLNNFSSDINIKTNNKGYILTNDKHMSNIQNLFVSGDVSDKGKGTVVNAVKQSKEVAQAIHNYIQNK